MFLNDNSSENVTNLTGFEAPMSNAEDIIREILAYKQKFSKFKSKFICRNPELCYIMPVSRTAYYVITNALEFHKTSTDVKLSFYTGTEDVGLDTLYFVCADKTKFMSKRQAKEALVDLLTKITADELKLYEAQQFNEHNYLQLNWLHEDYNLLGCNCTVAAVYKTCEELKKSEPDSESALPTEDERLEIYYITARNDRQMDNYIIPASINLKLIIEEMQRAVLIYHYHLTDSLLDKQAVEVLSNCNIDTVYSNKNKKWLQYITCNKKGPFENKYDVYKKLTNLIELLKKEELLYKSALSEQRPALNDSINAAYEELLNACFNDPEAKN